MQEGPQPPARPAFSPSSSSPRTRGCRPSPPLGPECTYPYPARPLWLQLALVSKDPTRFGFNSRIPPTAGYFWRPEGEELMDASKQLRERKTWRELYHRRLFPAPHAFSKIVTPFLPDSVFTLFREKGGNHLFRSSSRFNRSNKIQ